MSSAEAAFVVPTLLMVKQATVYVSRVIGVRIRVRVRVKVRAGVGVRLMVRLKCKLRAVVLCYGIKNRIDGCCF